MKGHKGFRLTRENIKNGLKFEDLTDGLGFVNGRMGWTNRERSSVTLEPTPLAPDRTLIVATSQTPTPSVISPSTPPAPPLCPPVNAPLNPAPIPPGAGGEVQPADKISVQPLTININLRKYRKRPGTPAPPENLQLKHEKLSDCLAVEPNPPPENAMPIDPPSAITEPTLISPPSPHATEDQDKATPHSSTKDNVQMEEAIERAEAETGRKWYRSWDLPFGFCSSFSRDSNAVLADQLFPPPGTDSQICSPADVEMKEVDPHASINSRTPLASDDDLQRLPEQASPHTEGLDSQNATAVNGDIRSSHPPSSLDVEMKDTDQSAPGVDHTNLEPTGDLEASTTSEPYASPVPPIISSWDVRPALISSATKVDNLPSRQSSPHFSESDESSLSDSDTSDVNDKSSHATTPSASKVEPVADEPDGLGGRSSPNSWTSLDYPLRSPDHEQFMLSLAPWTSEREMGDASSDSIESQQGTMTHHRDLIPPPPPPLPSPVPLRPEGSTSMSSISCRSPSILRNNPEYVTPRYHGRSSLLADESAMDPSPVVEKIVSMFRDTLLGLNDILGINGREDALLDSSPATSISRSRRSRAAPSHASSPPSRARATQSESLLNSELLDEIKSLQQRIQEDAEQKVSRDLEMQQLKMDMDDLRRQIIRMDRRISEDNNLSRALVSASSAHSFSSPFRHYSLEPSGSHHSPHPLSHLLAMDVEFPQPSPSSPQVAQTQSGESTVVVPNSLDLPEPSWGNSSPQTPNTQNMITTASPLTAPVRTPGPLPGPILLSEHDTPLPIKSQRKQRMMLMTTHQVRTEDQI